MCFNYNSDMQRCILIPVIICFSLSIWKILYQNIFTCILFLVHPYCYYTGMLQKRIQAKSQKKSISCLNIGIWNCMSSENQFKFQTSACHLKWYAFNLSQHFLQLKNKCTNLHNDDFRRGLWHTFFGLGPTICRWWAESPHFGHFD